MACEVQITNVIGLVETPGGLLDSVRVSGTAKGCTEVVVHTDCMKPSSVTSVVTYTTGNALGSWEVEVPYTEGGNRCRCKQQITVTALCVTRDGETCSQDEYTGILVCESPSQPVCPELLWISVLDSNGNDITEQVEHGACHNYGSYSFRVNVAPSLLPTYTINLTVKLDGSQIPDLSADPRVSNLSPDQSQFSLEFGHPTCIVEVIAAAFSGGFPGDGCQLQQGSIELQACECTCNPGTTFDPDTGQCEKPGCTDPNAPNYDPEATYDDGSCVPPRRGCTDPNAPNYDPEATIDDGSCETDNGGGGGGGNGGGSCGILCILAGIFLLAFPISAHISTAAFCASPIALAAQSALIVAAIGWFVRFCGTCCLYPFLYLGAVLGVIAVIVASIWLGFPDCIEVGLSLLIGYVLAAGGLQAACDNE